MNSFKLVLFSLIAGIMLSACGAPRYFIDEDWKGKPQPKNVKVVFTMPKVVVPDDLSDDLPEYTSNFAKWFGPELKQNLITRSQNGTQYSMKLIQPNEVSYKRRELADKDFMVPSFDHIQADADVYLVVTNTWIGRDCKWNDDGHDLFLFYNEMHLCLLRCKNEKEFRLWLCTGEEQLYVRRYTERLGNVTPVHG